MALVYRSVLEIDGEDPVGQTRRLFDAWVLSKYKDLVVELPPEDGEAELGESARVILATADDEHDKVLRARLVETMEGQVVTTTLTSIESGDDSWLWLDLSRSAENAWDRPWTPVAPRLLTQMLGTFSCFRGSSRLKEGFDTLSPEQAAGLIEEVMSPSREVPLVVVSPTRHELEGDLSRTRERAKQLSRRLAGITPVYMLGPGAVSGFSKAMLDAVGGGMDVHSGAIRVYLPGVGSERDWPGRHRLTPIDHFFRRRNPETAIAEFVARPVQQAASHQSPPEPWDRFRDMPQFSGGEASDEIWDEYEEVNKNLSAEIESLTEKNAELELEVMAFREESDEMLGEREDLIRRLRFYELQVRESGGDVVPPEDPAGVPSVKTCCEAVDFASSNLPNLAIGEKVQSGAEDLDEHSEPSWAKKSLRAMVALDEYVEAKKSGFEGNFLTFCSSGDLAAISTQSIALKESETTEQNTKYRQVRTFPVPSEVDGEGRMYMESHIKIEKGGSPAPRIHFYDDSQGETGKIHVGWLGPHLDNKSKN